MFEKKVEIIDYSGYRGEQTPRALIQDGERIEITEILSQWVEESFKERTRVRVFLCKDKNGNKYHIFYDEMRKEWYLK